MKTTILLNHTDNTRIVEDEERSKFFLSILDQIGLPLDDVWDGALPLSVDCRKKIRQLLTTYSVQVIDDNDGHMEIFVENNKVAEWFKSSFKLKRDTNQRDPLKQLYIEMTTNSWSLFEQE